MPPEQDLSEPLLSDALLDDAEIAVLRVGPDDGGDDHSNNGPCLSEHVSSGDDNNNAVRSPYDNHNVRLCLLLCAVSGVADSVWGSVVLSGFLFALAAAMGDTKKDNTLVGFAEMVQGISMLIFALPIGMWADRVGKAKVSRIGGGLMLLTCAITLWALIVVDKEAMENVHAAKQSYIIMLVALALWGIVSGISNGPIQALYSDSIPKGKRSELLTWLYSCYLISSSVGPIVSIAMLSSSNAEDWSIAEIFPVFFLGIVLEIPAAIIMFFFSDKYVVPEDDGLASLGAQTVLQSADNVDRIATNDASEGDALPSRQLASEADMLSPLSVPSTMTLSPPQRVDTTAATARRRMLSLTKSDVPYILFMSSLVVAVGSGASVKYFPLFFKEIGLSSSVVQGIYFVVPVSISAFSFVGQRLGKRFGRIETSTAFNTFGTLLLFYLTWLSRRVDEADTFGKTLIVIIYLLRTGIMNCCYPLLESVLMDAVPSNQRAKWKSLESISAFGWTGSALVGGILSDKHSYQYTFAMTATVQLLGGLMMWPIRSLVESEEEASFVSADEAATIAAAAAASDAAITRRASNNDTEIVNDEVDLLNDPLLKQA